MEPIPGGIWDMVVPVLPEEQESITTTFTCMHVNLSSGATATEIMTAIADHILEQKTIVGKYGG